jgi:PBSX family phage terminase large subunit
MKAKITLSKTQDDFVLDQTRFTAFIGGIGSGKSFAGAVKALLNAKAGTIGLVLAPTYPMLRDATLRTFRDIAGEAIVDFSKSDMIARMVTGGEILFRSADNPERLRGPNLHWAWIDEGALCPPDTWDIVIGRLRADGLAGPCWITSTPKGRNWLYHRRDMMKIYKAKTAENRHLSPDFIQSLRDSYSGDFARQELEGEFISLEGRVYNMFGEANIQQRDLKDFQQFGLAMDEGYTNPAVILLIGEDSDRRLHICREYYERGKLQSDVVATAKQWYNEFSARLCAVDASAAGLIADLRNSGVAASPAKGRVLDGIQAVQNRLQIAGDGRPRLTVSPDCTATISEFESYVWKPLKDEPVKENDHAMDAIRYYLDANTRGGWLITTEGNDYADEIL